MSAPDDIHYRGWIIRKARFWSGFAVFRPNDKKPYSGQPSLEFAKKLIDRHYARASNETPSRSPATGAGDQ